MKNLLRSKYSILFLAVFVVLLYMLQSKAIVPFVLKVVESNAFFEPEKEEEQLGKIKNERTSFGYIQCKDALKGQGTVPETAEFGNDQYEAWALGNRTYVIRSQVRFVDPEKGQVEHPFLCKLQLLDGDATQAKNWSIMGVEYNPGTEGE